MSAQSPAATAPAAGPAGIGPLHSHARRRAERRAETRRTRGLLLGKSRLARVLALLILALFAASWLLPLLWALDTSFKSEVQAQSLPLQWLPDGGFTLENYRTVFERGEVFTWMPPCI